MGRATLAGVLGGVVGVSEDGAWLRIDSLDLEARGVARDLAGKVVFVEGALPGEEVQVDVQRRRAHWEQGSARALRSESTQRARPVCPHFGLHAGACGGCKMQHLDASGQIAVKQRVLEDALWHLGKVRAEGILRPIEGPSWGYRGRARLSVRFVAKKKTVLVGFHERKSSYVADMQSCPILAPHAGRLLMPLRELIGAMQLRDRIPQVELAVGDDATALVLRHLGALSGADLDRLRVFGAEHAVQWWLQPGGPQTARPLDDADSALGYRLAEFDVAISFRPTDFTQVNTPVNRALVSRAVRLLAPSRDERVIDWFCGLGNFTLPLAKRAGGVLGIEGNEALIEQARRNAVSNGLASTARFAPCDLFELPPGALRAYGTAHKWLVDPPREGALALVKALCELRGAADWQPPSRILMVSCNPATLARDAGLLVHQAGYRCTQAGIVNMFPHTAHVEAIALFDAP